MNKLELRTQLRAHPDTKSIFVDAKSSDTLPARARKRRPCAYISNTAKAHEPGEHWVCFYFNKLDAAAEPNEYFDSTGQPPMLASFRQLLGESYIFNRRMLQSPLSTVCGQYCMYYIRMRSKGFSPEEIIEQFSSEDLLANDRKVNAAARKHFGTKHDIYDARFLRPRIFGHILRLHIPGNNNRPTLRQVKDTQCRKGKGRRGEKRLFVSTGISQFNCSGNGK